MDCVEINKRFSIEPIKIIDNDLYTKQKDYVYDTVIVALNYYLLNGVCEWNLYLANRRHTQLMLRIDMFNDSLCKYQATEGICAWWEQHFTRRVSDELWRVLREHMVAIDLEQAKYELILKIGI